MLEDTNTLEYVREKCKTRATIDGKFNNEAFVNCKKEQKYDEVTDLDEKLSKNVIDYMRLCNDEKFKDILKKTPCNKKDINFEMIADESKFDKHSRQKMIDFFNIFDAYIKERAAIFRQDPTELSKNKADYLEFSELNINNTARLDLMNGKITWGEFNKISKESYTKRLEAFRKLNDTYTNKVKELDEQAYRNL
jgi:hypothetical protein